MPKSIIASLALLLAIIASPQAQDDSNFSSTINWFYSACEDRMVVDLYGTVQQGFDIYYQAFDLFAGNGTALTPLRRVNANGDYSITQTVYWLGRETRDYGSPISVVFRIAREFDPDRALFQEASDDFLGECEEPGSTLEEDPTINAGDIIGSSGVFTPSGAMLNPRHFVPPEDLVHIGARPSEITDSGRTANPGLIFAECADVNGAEPGVVYDSDDIIVFWSWFARTQEQVASHIANARYEVKVGGQTIPEFLTSDIKQIPGSRDWWVFYTAYLGDKWKPGRHGIDFAVTWVNPISDGYEDFGPGTDNQRLDSGCLFTVSRDPDNYILHENPTWPLSVYNERANDDSE